ncbi:lysozyme inhibitor LprI family protein [Marinimicrobium sp. ABcell2]|uniref:lysozyme inhibitor LprI family protein n=1 Tax=Marinimicrobium sp. ABcell2 TaxID=3069751 RepID=UPI0027B3E3D9|nr:lysozyme inhibitor LprI family protein [Marinimicrobium sp. ABcell2]MDQ2076697.1 lysozyme inhibitor LprI family protein [Marinimicrobium sp. ABcell2]
MRPIFLALAVIPSVSTLASDVDCKDPITTIEVNVCKNREVERAEATLAKYLQASLDRHEGETEVGARIEESQERWLEYRAAHCGAIYEMWIQGTIRGVMYGQCQLELTQVRTHELWRAYLTYMDSTPPILPEPDVAALD